MFSCQLTRLSRIFDLIAERINKLFHSADRNTVTTSTPSAGIMLDGILAGNTQNSTGTIDARRLEYLRGNLPRPPDNEYKAYLGANGPFRLYFALHKLPTADTADKVILDKFSDEKLNPAQFLKL